ncbi:MULTISPECIES: Mur ligase family protein [Methanobacterium]|jgi:UDP-N-acetylmuramoylalanine--D-glutamate ligase|uniref:UDP-N-acetylmuramoyl-L-alanine--D-glutamate ligase n=1 Tax=Methanobacterium subterraneum TaxID=59277 RepID=A0A2H4VP14_9EURY|nr:MULTISPECIES: Mur ligase family protein [Methanobacterium]MBW4257571.1 UDP-N-acetylmuramoyl-L-alanine--D-glutamate ligase [Methanobacterium sp. YSL]AUB58880.1 UDP-N-acetylmuramoyl-L-alanine--D-glutamate ligase [Methanobacterium sp. MZ-A1]AUB59829.1 UDP-N-acetylmuramoyl-L-alanine--D-glutamate ligase [Methanobacterium subterraneum]MCC7559348.1 UDP-N-acetylmuramoyl-L-alanine--D-glutamate ligase [Methanobacterium sp.]NMO08715.1 UDP-N-acetylmuramoyl-L-alanine--D-glutamate ligase [Methanobacteriu
MKCVVIGAGNAGRPAARILNYAGHQVQITDEKEMEEFPENVQKTLKKMEGEGVNLQLGWDDPTNIEDVDAVYISPNIPKNSPIRHYLIDNELKLLINQDISQIVDNTINIDVIGVTGTLGKTSTTHIISDIFENAGYKVWTCSSLSGNLLSEVIVDGIISGDHLKSDIAVLELPHGTIRLLSELKLKVGLITNIYSDHLSEFEGSLEKYTKRKMMIIGSSEILVSSSQCREILNQHKTLYYCSQGSDCDIYGYLKNGDIGIKYKIKGREGDFKTEFNLRGYYFENSVAAAAVALAYGLKEESIKHGLNKFKGIPGHLEYIGNYSGRKIHFDAAFVPEGIISTLKQFSQDESDLVILIDNPDSTNPRDKFEIGKILGEYAQVIIASGYNETTGILDMKSAQEVLEGAKDSKAVKITTENMITAGEYAIKNSKPGDIILHIGPGAITNYEDLKSKMMRGIEKGCKKYP